jgi:acyl carrier protein
VGISAILPDEGLDALEMWIGEPAAQVAVMPANWPRFIEQLPQEYAATFFADLESRLKRERRVSESDAVFRKQLRAAIGKTREGLLSSHVRKQVMSVLNLPATADLNPQEGFFDLGMDSLMATEVRNRLQSSLDIPLPATIVLEHGNLTFGSLHNLFKLNGRVFDLWSQILRELPNSRLLVFRDMMTPTAQPTNCVNGRPLLARSATASRLNSSVN